MAGLKKLWSLGVILIIALATGCSGVLFESKQEDGKVQRLRLDGGESWDSFDDKPRNPYKDGKKLDDMSIFLKKEATF